MEDSMFAFLAVVVVTVSSEHVIGFGGSVLNQQINIAIQDPSFIVQEYLIHGVKTPRLSPAPEITSDRYESPLAVIHYHPLRPVLPTRPSRLPHKKPPRKPPPPPNHLVAESLLPPQEEAMTSSPELKPIPPLPPPIPPLSSQVHGIKEGGSEQSLPPPRPQSQSTTQTNLVRYVRHEDGIGNYYFRFESEDGTVRKERGSLKTIQGHKVTVKRGHYKYLSPEGVSQYVDYTADELGYRPFVYYENNIKRRHRFYFV